VPELQIDITNTIFMPKEQFSGVFKNIFLDPDRRS
jgi:hypothetical protein